MKKLLASLMGVSLIASTTISVVACGSKDPDKTLKLGYNAAFTNWNTAKTMQQEDHSILSNTNATPLGTDRYSRQYGDLFEVTNEEYGTKDPYIGKHNKDFNEFIYKLRENATWSDYKGKKVRNIGVEDFVNTAKYVLNVGNASPLTSLWTSFIKGASKIIDEQKENKKSFDTVWNEQSKNLGIKVNETDRTVKFELTKNTSYFETLLTYSVFSPIHDDMLTSEARNQDFKKSYFSGAFIPTKFKNEQDLILDKNDNYHLKEDTHLNRLRYKWTVGGVDKPRTLFDSGALDQFKPVVSDEAGWNEYIGEDPNSPKATAGLSWTDESPDNATTFVWMFNVNNSDYNKSGKTDKRALAAGRALQNKEVRKFISTNLNRNTYVNYFSKAFDKGKTYSSLVRNTYTPNYAIPGEEEKYSDHLVEALNAKKGIVGETKLTVKDIEDGNDFLHGRKKDIWDKEDKLMGEVKAWMTKDVKINEAMKENKGKLTLYIPIHPATNATSKPLQLDMMRNFNEIEGNPIEIKEIDGIIDQNKYAEIQNNGAYDILNLGWTWDYQDAYSYLDTFKIGGDLSGFVGTSRMFHVLNASNFEQPEFNDYNDKHVHGDAKDFIVPEITEEYYDEIMHYSRSVKNIDLNKSGEERLKLFADQEVDMVYDSFRFIPMLKRGLPRDFTVSYATPFGLSTAGYGVSGYRYWSIDKSTDLLSAEEIAKIKEEYLKNKGEVLLDPTKHQETSAWKK